MKMRDSTPLVIQCRRITQERLDQVLHGLFQSGFYNLKTEVKERKNERF